MNRKKTVWDDERRKKYSKMMAERMAALWDDPEKRQELLDARPEDLYDKMAEASSEFMKKRHRTDKDFRKKVRKAASDGMKRKWKKDGEALAAAVREGKRKGRIKRYAENLFLLGKSVLLTDALHTKLFIDALEEKIGRSLSPDERKQIKEKLRKSLLWAKSPDHLEKKNETTEGGEKQNT